MLRAFPPCWPACKMRVGHSEEFFFMIFRVWKRAYIGRWLRLGFETSAWSLGLSLSQNHPNLRPNVLLHEISTRANTDRIRIQIQIIGIISDVVFAMMSLNKSYNLCPIVLFQHTFQSTYIKKSKSHRANINWSVLWCNGKTPSRLDWRRIQWVYSMYGKARTIRCSMKSTSECIRVGCLF